MYTLRKIKNGSEYVKQLNTNLGNSYLLIENKESEEFQDELKENLSAFEMLGIVEIMSIVKCESGKTIALNKGYTYYFMLDGNTIDKRVY